MDYDKIMLRCIDLAKKGAGLVSPNPLVGCVIVKDNKIIAEGYHRKFGSDHAEVNAISSALKKGSNLKDAILFTNLEPCFHYGKTPPCVDLIISKKIKKVVLGIQDPNRSVNGKSIKKLRENKIEVKTGILADECKSLNRFYSKYITTSLPYVALKVAQTLDGKIADENYKSKWITSYESRKFVHKLRSEFDAVLIGRNTLELDDPQLTVRHVKGRNPYRIILDRELRANPSRKVFKDKFREKTIIITALKASDKVNKLKHSGVQIINSKIIKNKIQLKEALEKISAMGISSILVEGGANTISEFIKQRMYDELLIFIAPKIMGNGLSSFIVDGHIDFSRIKGLTSENIGSDLLINIKMQ